MADRSTILSADAEEKLLQPIEEYVGKIQAQIDELRVEGSDKVRSLKNHIAIAKEDKNLSKDERDRMIAKDKADLEKAKIQQGASYAVKDGVLRIIRNGPNPPIAREQLMSRGWKSDLVSGLLYAAFNPQVYRPQDIDAITTGMRD